MKILIYSYNYAPEPIGIAPLVTELAEGLVKRGHEVRVLTGMPNYPERQIYEGYRGKLYINEERNGVAVHRCYVWVRPKPGLIGRVLLDGSFVVTSFLRALNGWRPDAILLTSPPLPVSVPAAVLSRLARCPVVLSLQDILPEAAVQTGLLSNRCLIRVFEQLERFTYRHVHRIAVIAEGFVANLEGKGVPLEKMTLIPNWVDVDAICPMPKENAFREKHGLSGKFVVLYSGNIALTQGLETVLEAAARLVDRPEIQFAIVGAAPAIAKLRDYCQTHQIAQENVRLMPFVPDAEFPEMLAAADVSLIIQKCNVVGFNMPSKTQKILASGRAIVASVPDHGTAAYAVRASGGGVVVKPECPEALAEALLELSRQPGKVEEMGRRGRETAISHYSFQASLDRYERLFLELSGEANPFAWRSRRPSASAPAGGGAAFDSAHPPKP